jgi:hypothetical protein
VSQGHLRIYSFRYISFAHELLCTFQENGAAFEAGGLEVGQLILEVDGQKVEGKDLVERRFYTMEGIKRWAYQVHPSICLV